VSFISSWSLYCLEHFELWKRFGVFDALNSEAKLADALTVLDGAWKQELKDGEE
jgi:hypothetical protein